MAIKVSDTSSTTTREYVDISEESTEVVQNPEPVKVVTASKTVSPTPTSVYSYAPSEESEEIITNPDPIIVLSSTSPTSPTSEENDEIIANPTPPSSTSPVSMVSEENEEDSTAVPYTTSTPTVKTIQDIALSDFSAPEDTSLSLLKQQVQYSGTVSESQLASVGISYAELQKSLDLDHKTYELALNKVKSLQDSKGNFSLVKALEKGVTPKELLALGISISEINKAQDMGNSDKILSKYTDKTGSLDAHSAIRDGVQKRVFTSAGYDSGEIDKVFTSVTSQLKIETYIEGNPWSGNLLGYLKDTKDFKTAESAGYDNKQIEAFKSLISKGLISDSGEIKIEESLETRDLIPLLKLAGISSDVINKARVNILAKQAVDRKGGAAGFLVSGGSVGSLVTAGFSTEYVNALESVKGYLDPKTNTVDVSKLSADGKLNSKINKSLTTLGYKQSDIDSVAEASRLQVTRNRILGSRGGSASNVDFNPVGYYSSSSNKPLALKDLESLGYSSEVTKSLDSLSDSKVLDSNGGFDWKKISRLESSSQSRVVSDLESLGIKSEVSTGIIKEVRLLQELEPYIDSKGTVDLSSVLRGSEGDVSDEALRYVGLSEKDVEWRKTFVETGKPSRVSQGSRSRLNLSPMEALALKEHTESPEYIADREARHKAGDPNRQLTRSLLSITPIVGTVLYVKEASKGGFSRKELAWIGVQALLEASMVLPAVGAVGRAGIVGTRTAGGIGAAGRAGIASRNVGVLAGSALTSAVQFPILATRSIVRPFKVVATAPWKAGQSAGSALPGVATSSRWGVPISKSLPIVAETGRLAVKKTAFGISKASLKKAIKVKKSIKALPTKVINKFESGTGQVVATAKSLPLVPVRAVVKTAKGLSGSLDIGEAVVLSGARKAGTAPKSLASVSGPKAIKGLGRGARKGIKGGYGVAKEAFNMPISKFIKGYVSDYTYPIIHPMKTIKGVYRVGTGGVALGAKDAEKYSGEVLQSFKSGTPYASRDPLVSRVQSGLRGYNFRSKLSTPKKRLDVRKLKLAGGAAVDAPIRPGGYPRSIRPYTIKGLDATTGVSIVPSTGRSITPGRFIAPEGVVEAPIRPGVRPETPVKPSPSVPEKPPGPGQPRRDPSPGRPRRDPEPLPDSPRPTRTPSPTPSTPTPSRPSRVQPGAVPVIPVEPMPLSPFLPIKPKELEFVEPKVAVTTVTSSPFEFGSLEELKTAGSGIGVSSSPLVETSRSPFSKPKIDFTVLPYTKPKSKIKESVETITEPSTEFETETKVEPKTEPETKVEPKTETSVKTNLEFKTLPQIKPLTQTKTKTPLELLARPPKPGVGIPFPRFGDGDEKSTRNVILVTSVSPKGSGSVSPGTREIVEDSIITISPESNIGWRFDHWEGDVPEGHSTRRSLSILMEDSKRVVGVFIPGDETALVTSKIQGLDIILPTGNVVTKGIAHTRHTVPTRLTGLPSKLILGRRPIRAEVSRFR